MAVRRRTRTWAFPRGVAVDQRNGTSTSPIQPTTRCARSRAPGRSRVWPGPGRPARALGFCGDGGPATSAQLNAPGAVTVDRQGNLYIADSGDNEIRMVSATGKISRVAGDGRACSKAGACGDGGAATRAQLYGPHGVAVDRVRASCTSPTAATTRSARSQPDRTITTVAGNGSACASPPSCGDGSDAKQAQLSYPDGLTLDSPGNLFIADQGDDEIRKLSATAPSARSLGNGATCASPPTVGRGSGDQRQVRLSRTGWPPTKAGNVAVADTMDHEVGGYRLRTQPSPGSGRRRVRLRSLRSRPT